VKKKKEKKKKKKKKKKKRAKYMSKIETKKRNAMSRALWGRGAAMQTRERNVIREAC